MLTRKQAIRRIYRKGIPGKEVHHGKGKPHVRAYPKVVYRVSRIRIGRLYHTALYQREREDSLTVRSQCV